MSLTPPTRKPSQSCYISQSCIHPLLLPGGRKLLRALVVASETVNTALDENQTELGVAVLSVALQVLSHGHSLLDQEVHVLGDGGSQSYSLTRHTRPPPFFFRILRILEPVTAFT